MFLSRNMISANEKIHSVNNEIQEKQNKKKGN